MPLHLAVLTALLLVACDGGTWLSANEVAHFREVPPSEAVRIAARPGAQVLQTGPRYGHRVEGSEHVAPGGSWPSGTGQDGPVVVVAPDLPEGYRLAARLARAGIQDVVIVAGGLDAWRAHEMRDSEEVAAAAAQDNTRE